MSKADLEEQEAKMENMSNDQDLEYAVQMSRWLLQPLGLWPMESSTYPRILQSFSIAICSFLLIFLLIPSCLYIFLIEKDFRIRLKLVGPLSFSLMNICKYFGILAKRREIRACLAGMAVDWRETGASPAERRIMLRSTRAARLFIAICALFMYCGGLPYTVVLPIARGAVLIGNVSLRHFAYPSYFVFFDPHTRPNFDMVYSIHCLCGVVTYTVTCGLCSLAIVFILHICGQMAVISWMLQNLAGNFDKKSLGKIVRKHIRSLRFASKLEGILSGMCSVEMIGCTFNICMLGYYFITEYEQSEHLGPLVYSLLLTSLTFNIFIFCYIGDLLTERCNSLGEIAYMVDWYQLSAKEAQNLILIVAETRHPVVLTGGKLVTLSLRSFTNVLKVSLTYLNMLRTLTANAS